MNSRVQPLFFAVVFTKMFGLRAATEYPPLCHTWPQAPHPQLYASPPATVARVCLEPQETCKTVRPERALRGGKAIMKCTRGEGGVLM